MSIEDRIQRLKGGKPGLDDLKKTKGSSKGTWGGQTTEYRRPEDKIRDDILSLIEDAGKE